MSDNKMNYIIYAKVSNKAKSEWKKSQKRKSYPIKEIINKSRRNC